MSDDQHLWVADGITQKFVKFDLNGKLLYSWGTFGAFPGGFWGVHQFHVDSEGSLYTADVHVGRPQKFRPKRGPPAARGAMLALARSVHAHVCCCYSRTVPSCVEGARSMAQSLQGKKIAALVTDGFEQSELVEPRKALQQEGAEVLVVSPKAGEVKGWDHTHWGTSVRCDMKVEEARADDFDGLLLPGGVMSPDKLRIDANAVAFVKGFVDAGKPIAAICHGPWTLIEAGAVDGRTMTSYPSVRTDLVNAGARWVDKEVVVDNGLVTSRNPSDIPAFNREMIEEFAEGRHQPSRAGQVVEHRAR